MPQEAVIGEYADYRYYKERYGGSSIPEDQFKRCSRWATKLVDQITFGRVQKMAYSEVPDFVKDAVCAASECYYLQWQSEAGGARSETNDGYSITYAGGGDKTKMASQAVSLVKTYLEGSGLLYRGVYRPHCWR